MLRMPGPRAELRWVPRTAQMTKEGAVSGGAPRAHVPSHATNGTCGGHFFSQREDAAADFFHLLR